MISVLTAELVRIAWIPTSMGDALREIGYTQATGRTLAGAKKAYRKMAMKWHPDRNPGQGATAKMQRLNKAWAFIQQHAEHIGDNRYTQRGKGTFYNARDFYDDDGKTKPGGAGANPWGDDPFKDMNWDDFFRDFNQRSSANDRARAQSQARTRARQEKQAKQAQKVSSIFAIAIGIPLATAFLYKIVSYHQPFNRLKLWIDRLKKSGWIRGKQLTVKQKEDLVYAVYDIHPKEYRRLLKAAQAAKKKAA